MSFITTIPITFPSPRTAVYEALCDLSRYPLWHSSMVYISSDARLHEGMEFETAATVAGQTNRTRVTVERLIPDQEIELVSRAGTINFRVVYKLAETTPGQTQVSCRLKFEFSNFVLNLAKSTIESMAQARLRGDLETLRAIVADASQK